MHDGMPYGRNQGQGQGHSREIDCQSPTGLIFYFYFMLPQTEDELVFALGQTVWTYADIVESFWDRWSSSPRIAGVVDPIKTITYFGLQVKFGRNRSNGIGSPKLGALGPCPIGLGTWLTPNLISLSPASVVIMLILVAVGETVWAYIL